MKTVYGFFTFALIAIIVSMPASLDAQVRRVDKLNKTVRQNPKGNLYARDTEIVFYPTIDDTCSLTVALFNITDNWGQVSGTNQFGDKEKAQRLEFTSSATYRILGAAAFFNTPGIVGNGPVRALIYSTADGNGSPDELLAVSDSILVGDLIPPNDTSVLLTPFVFNEGQVATLNRSQFFVSIDLSALYESNDTLAIFQTNPDCGDGLDTWERWFDDTWHSIFEAWQGLHADFLLAAIVEFEGETSSDQNISHQGLSIFPATPNPVSERTAIHYALENSGPVEILIFDNSGKQIHHIKHDLQLAGRHQQEIITQDWNPGNYYYYISSGEGRLVSTLVVQH